MKTKKAEDKDLDSIFRLSKARILHSPLTRSELSTYANDKDFDVLALRTDDKTIIGYAILRYEMDEAEIDEIAILKEYEGKGIGTFLLREVLEILKEKNIYKVFLEVRKKNFSAIRLYEHNGFIQYRIRKNYYGDDDALCYLKELHI